LTSAVEAHGRRWPATYGFTAPRTRNAADENGAAAATSSGVSERLPAVRGPRHRVVLVVAWASAACGAIAMAPRQTSVSGLGCASAREC